MLAVEKEGESAVLVRERGKMSHLLTDTVTRCCSRFLLWHLRQPDPSVSQTNLTVYKEYFSTMTWSQLGFRLGPNNFKYVLLELVVF